MAGDICNNWGGPEKSKADIKEVSGVARIFNGAKIYIKKAFHSLSD